MLYQPVLNVLYQAYFEETGTGICVEINKELQENHAELYMFFCHGSIQLPRNERF